MKRTFTVIAFAVFLLCTACAPKKPLTLSEAYKTVPDSHLTVRNFVEAHETAMAGLGEIKTSSQKVQTSLDDLRAANQKAQDKALETAQRTLQIIEDISNRQGTGEITIFFPVDSASIPKGSFDFERLVHFADFLSRESRGRKIIILSIGSASAFGPGKTNLKLAEKRAEAPLEILENYLVNIPHEFHTVYGTGDMYSPKNVKMKEHQRYQHSRIIALFDMNQAPKFNEGLPPLKKR